MTGRIGPPHSVGLDDLLRAARIEQARKSGWPQFDEADLVFHRFGVVEHTASGQRFRLHRGEVGDWLYSSACAYYLTDAGNVQFLEPLR